jgi:predicted nucleotide-binding protein (sugar kinase/HSP70/actin superfamily)
VENGAHGLHGVLKEIVSDFRCIPVDKTIRKPVVAVLGEIFMRDNNFCNGHLIERLENLGVETMIAPFSEWVTYSTYRYKRDSKWKRDPGGYLKSNIQGFMQHASESLITRGLKRYIDSAKIAHLDDLLRMCNGYVHRDYDGDPPLAMGMASYLFKKGISGIAAILPFTCMPGTLIAAISDSFRKDHFNIPWINIAYDGQDSVTLDTRLQAFVYQVKEYTNVSANDCGDLVLFK